MNCGQYRAPKGRIRGGVDGSATVPIVAGVPLVTTAVVVFRREIIIEVPTVHVGGIIGGCLSATTDGSEGEAVEVGLFVCHVAIVGPNGSVGQTKSASASGVTASIDSSSYTRTHAIGSPVVRRQII